MRGAAYTGYLREVEMQIPSEILLFVLAGLIGLLVWYVDSHSEEKPRYKKPPRRRWPPWFRRYLIALEKTDCGAKR